MPVHAWNRVDAALFHDFHQGWTVALRISLNEGVLPPGYSARLEQRMRGPFPADIFADKANHISVRHRQGDVVAIVEIVSPGNKTSRAELRAFVERYADLLGQGVHLLVIDLFPPGRRDPQGLPQAIWTEFKDENLNLASDKPLALAAFDASEGVAYVEPVAVGDVLPAMPLFLQPAEHVLVPLEETYQATWNLCPRNMQRLVE